MSQQLRQLKSRIRSVEGTWKVTRAMEMVSMSKFKAMETPRSMARAYFTKLEGIFNNLLAVEADESHPYFKARTGALGLVVITSDTGLCGTYTNEIMRQVEKFLAANKERDIKIYVYGRKGATHFRKNGIPVEKSVTAIHGRMKFGFHKELLDAVMADYDNKVLGEVHVAYTVFKTALKRVPVIEKFLNIDRKPGGNSENFIVESGNGGILKDLLLPMYLSSRMRLMMLESFVSEQSSRMVAMKAAKDNAKELMGDLILLRNKLRQATITKEVIEIISSAEALKG